MIELETRLIVITGACGQLGAELCRTYADLGWTVCVTDIEVTACEKLAKSLSKKVNQKHIPISMDVTSEESVRKAIKHIENQEMSIDVLVNNAGTAVFSNFKERTKDEFMNVVEVNLFGAFNCINPETKKSLFPQELVVIISIVSTPADPL